ncbi:MAG: TetR/AcrR family transcriptional regulator [Treponema sp.]|nr:TetR/AcrR family transcriptional regulator [Treponema sp.]
MAESSTETKKKLLESAKKEFLEKGFNGASLRTIAANAGVTTGAMYRHFKDKNAFFCALVDDAIEVSLKVVSLAGTDNHATFDMPHLQEHINLENKNTFDFMDYIFDNFDAFTLLLTKAAGSEHENFQEEICELYTKNCQETFNWMYKQKLITRKVSPMTVHFMASTIINAFCDIILHKMTKKEASVYISDIMEFTRAGTIQVLGMNAGK